MEISQKTKDWYTSYYKNNPDRNDLRGNPQVLFQVLAMEASIINALRFVEQDPCRAKVLDVGCGSGGNYYQLVRLSYKFDNITGIDINEERIEEGKKVYLRSHFIVGDASRMVFPSECFDLVCESTMFATLPDDTLCKSIASEMVRVCKVGGYILLVDWRIPKLNNPNYNALTKKKLISFFEVGFSTKLIAMEKGALIPPIGRFLSKNIPSIYFLVCRIFPFLVGQVAYLLRKQNSTDDKTTF
jgi:ubiquinone/menaquinone biosynthesis C-methylase UbiE